MVLPEQLQKQYGGTAENRTDVYWPPECPTHNFGNKEERIKKADKKPKNSVKSTAGVRTLFQKKDNSL